MCFRSREPRLPGNEAASRKAEGEAGEGQEADLLELAAICKNLASPVCEEQSRWRVQSSEMARSDLCYKRLAQAAGSEQITSVCTCMVGEEGCGGKQGDQKPRGQSESHCSTPSVGDAVMSCRNVPSMKYVLSQSLGICLAAKSHPLQGGHSQ